MAISVKLHGTRSGVLKFGGLSNSYQPASSWHPFPSSGFPSQPTMVGRHMLNGPQRNGALFVLLGSPRLGGSGMHGNQCTNPQATAKHTSQHRRHSTAQATCHGSAARAHCDRSKGMSHLFSLKQVVMPLIFSHFVIVSG